MYGMLNNIYIQNVTWYMVEYDEDAYFPHILSIFKVDIGFTNVFPTHLVGFGLPRCSQVWASIDLRMKNVLWYQMENFFFSPGIPKNIQEVLFCPNVQKDEKLFNFRPWVHSQWHEFVEILITLDKLII